MTSLIINFIAMTTFTFPALPYELNELEPQISKETMEYHYGKHLQTYITNLNNLIKGTDFEEKSLEQIVMTSTGAIFNNAAQTYNHTFYFNTLSPNPQTAPTGELARAIDRDFGSFDQFKETFSKAAIGLFGSGWAWLVKDKDGKLWIEPEGNAGNPMTRGLTPLLTFDVWEHAYYIDYRNRRADHVNTLWNKINWKVIEERFHHR